MPDLRLEVRLPGSCLDARSRPGPQSQGYIVGAVDEDLEYRMSF
jgi:hypothetical protein